IVGLKPEQRKKVDQGGVFSGKDVLFFADHQETRQLNLIPSQGFVVISQIGVEAQIPKEMPDGVPSPATALQSTLEILDKIGVSRSEIATNSDGQVKASYTESEVIHKDKTDGQIKTNIVKRELYLNRQIDGIPVLGNRSGVTAHFGNKGKLGYLSVVWRAIVPERDCIVPNATELICRIKDGQALIPNWAQGHYKKIIIEKVHIYYWENSGAEPQTHIYPFIILNVKAEKENREIKMDLFVPFAEK
ncbi:MAG TPA: hypothetical protein PLW02_06615, partial [Verrucomicrobiota bacterium]|nr:hypothetical protein [Verrucomicrobiota bacterium]